MLELHGHRLGVAGVKGFGGGFAGRCASEFGEREMKAFVRHHRGDRRRGSATALRGLDCDVRVALTHYAPVPDTLVGEPLEIYPFLGSYLLGQAIDSAPTALAVHGHAHAGTRARPDARRGAGAQRRPPGHQAGVQRVPAAVRARRRRTGPTRRPPALITGFRFRRSGYPTGMDLLLWILAVILVVAGILALFRRQILWGVVLIIVGLLVGPGGVSIFT